MKANSKLHQAKLQQWAALISDQNASGLKIKDWCTANGVSFHAYNYWKHILKQQVVDQVIPDIVPISLSQASITVPAGNHDIPDRAICANRTNPADVRMSINGISFELESSVPESFLISLLRAVRYA